MDLDRCLMFRPGRADEQHVTTMTDIRPAGWAEPTVGERCRPHRVRHGHRIVMVLVAVTLFAGVLVVTLAGLLHGHGVAQFVGIGFAVAATTLWLAAGALLGPHQASTSGIDPITRHDG